MEGYIKKKNRVREANLVLFSDLERVIKSSVRNIQIPAHYLPSNKL